jgi:ATP-dependent Clp protease ATP-binding subunit ClpX
VATSVKTDTVKRCSFCGKESTEVAKMVAGPGVYICNVCVGLCVTVIDKETVQGTEAHVPPTTMTDEQILEYIPRIAAVEDQVEQSLREWVGRLRERGITWERIGASLGMTRQSAWGRFSGEQ